MKLYKWRKKLRVQQNYKWRKSNSTPFKKNSKDLKKDQDNKLKGNTNQE